MLMVSFVEMWMCVENTQSRAKGVSTPCSVIIELGRDGGGSGLGEGLYAYKKVFVSLYIRSLYTYMISRIFSQVQHKLSLTSQPRGWDRGTLFWKII